MCVHVHAPTHALAHRGLAWVKFSVPDLQGLLRGGLTGLLPAAAFSVIMRQYIRNRLSIHATHLYICIDIYIDR